MSNIYHLIEKMLNLKNKKSSTKRLFFVIVVALIVFMLVSSSLILATADGKQIKDIKVKHDGMKWNAKEITSSLQNLTFNAVIPTDKKTTLQWIPASGTCVGYTAKIIYDSLGNPILDNKGKPIEVKCESGKCDGKACYNIDLTLAAAVNIDDDISLGDKAFISAYENSSYIYLNYTPMYVKASTYKFEDSKKTLMQNSIFLKSSGAFGFVDSLAIEDSSYVYVFEASNNFQKMGDVYYIQDNNKIKINVDDICTNRTEEIYDNETGNTTINVLFAPQCSYDLVSSNRLEVSFDAEYNSTSGEVNVDPFLDVTCDTGDLQTICYLNHTYTASDGETINGTGSLVIQDSGDINYTNVDISDGTWLHGASIIVDFDGNITILNGGQINVGNVTVIADNLTIESGGSIDTHGLGYFDGDGPGYSSGKGGSYGGRGGLNTVNTYGSSIAPTDFGSGGNFIGGGIIKINVNNAIIDGILNCGGEISSPALHNTGGGAGGSVWITATNFSGGGAISATGGYGTVGNNRKSGGGGRISFTNVSDYNYLGTLSVSGGSQGFRGHAGTITWNQNELNNFTVSNTIKLGNDINYTFGNLTILSGGSLQLDGDEYTGKVNANSLSGYEGTGGIINAEKVDIKSGGQISVYTLGFDMYRGPGMDTNAYSGASYGGMGSAIGWAESHLMPIYSSYTQPIALGSGGGDVVGGGAVKINAIDVIVDGTISANGKGTSIYAGSSGGSIWIVATNLSGEGVITSRGGSGRYGGGGGGRISLEADYLNFIGTIEARGNANYNSGYGTIFLNFNQSINIASATINSPFVLGRYNQYGKLLYTDVTQTTNKAIPFEDLMQITDNKIHVDATTYTDLNISANLTFYSLNLTSKGIGNPIAFRNGDICDSSYCGELTSTNISDMYDFYYSVTGFTNYSIGSPIILNSPEDGTTIIGQSNVTLNITGFTPSGLMNVTFYNVSINESIFTYNITDDALVGLWAFNESNANDLSGNGNDGIVSGATYNVYDGALGYSDLFGCYEFDDGDEIDCGTDPSLDLGTHFSAFAWVKQNSDVDNGGVISKDSAQASPYSWMLTAEVTADSEFGAYDGTNWHESSGAGLTLGNWHHLGWIHNETTIDYYVDGNYISSSAFSYTDDPNDNVYIGSWYSTESTYDLDGSIDEVRLYNRIFSAAEIQNLYELGTYHNYTRIVTTNDTIIGSTLNIATGITTSIVWMPINIIDQIYLWYVKLFKDGIIQTSDTWQFEVDNFNIKEVNTNRTAYLPSEMINANYSIYNYWGVGAIESTALTFTDPSGIISMVYTPQSYSDKFTGEDNWTEPGGTNYYNIDAERLQFGANGGSASYASNVLLNESFQKNLTDLSVSVDIMVDYAGEHTSRLIFWYKNETNYADVFVSQTYSAIGIEEYINGVRYKSETSHPFTEDSWHNLRVSVVDGTATVFWDDISWQSRELVSTPSGRFGIGTDASWTYYDNYSIGDESLTLLETTNQTGYNGANTTLIYGIELQIPASADPGSWNITASSMDNVSQIESKTESFLVPSDIPTFFYLGTYNSSLSPNSIFDDGDNVTIRGSVADAQGSSDIGSVLILNLTMPNGTSFQDAFYILNEIDYGYNYEFNYTIPIGVSSEGEWVVDTYVNDSSGYNSTDQVTFEVLATIPSIVLWTNQDSYDYGDDLIVWANVTDTDGRDDISWVNISLTLDGDTYINTEMTYDSDITNGKSYHYTRQFQANFGSHIITVTAKDTDHDTVTETIYRTLYWYDSGYNYKKIITLNELFNIARTGEQIGLNMSFNNTHLTHCNISKIINNGAEVSYTVSEINKTNEINCFYKFPLEISGSESRELEIYYNATGVENSYSPTYSDTTVQQINYTTFDCSDYFGSCTSTSITRIQSVFSEDQILLVTGRTSDAGGNNKAFIQQYNITETSKTQANLVKEADVTWQGIDESFGYSVIKEDLNNDGSYNLITGGTTHNVTDGANYGELIVWNFTNNVTGNAIRNVTWVSKGVAGEENHTEVYVVKAKDVTGDSDKEIITGGKKGGENRTQLMVWNSDDLTLIANASWGTGYPSVYDYITSLEIEDIDDDGVDEIIVAGTVLLNDSVNCASDVWVEAFILIYNMTDGDLELELAYDYYKEDLTEIFSIAVDDIDGDGTLELITGGNWYNCVESVDLAHLRVYNYTDNTLTMEGETDWEATGHASILTVVTEDIDNDNTHEIITSGFFNDGTTDRAHERILEFDGTTFTTQYYNSLTIESSPVRDADYSDALSVNDYNNDGIYEIFSGGRIGMSAPTSTFVYSRSVTGISSSIGDEFTHVYHPVIINYTIYDDDGDRIINLSMSENMTINTSIVNDTTIDTVWVSIWEGVVDTSTELLRITLGLVDTVWTAITVITTVPEGTYNYSLNVNVTTGGSDQENSTIIIIGTSDNTPPNITLNTPGNNTYSNIMSHNLTVNLIDDNLGLKNSTLYVYNSSDLFNSTSIDYSATNPLNATLGIVINFSVDGVYTWFYDAYDDNDNYNISSDNYTITIDTVNPIVNLIVPLNDTYTNVQTQNYTANLTDELSGIKNATLYIYNSTGDLSNQTTETFSENILTTILGITVTLTDDVYTWFYELFDYA